MTLITTTDTPHPETNSTTARLPNWEAAFVRRVASLVSDSYEVDVEDMFAPNRRRRIVRARWLVWWVAVHSDDISMCEVARQFDMDSTTVLYGCNQVEKRRRADPAYAEETDELLATALSIEDALDLPALRDVATPTAGRVMVDPVDAPTCACAVCGAAKAPPVAVNLDANVAIVHGRMVRISPHAAEVLFVLIREADLVTSAAIAYACWPQEIRAGRCLVTRVVRAIHQLQAAMDPLGATVVSRIAKGYRLVCLKDEART